MNRLDKLKTSIAIENLQDLEKDLLYFYDYLLFLKNVENEDSYLKYNGVYVNCLKMLIDLDLDLNNKPRIFNRKNFITNYIILSKKFNLKDFQHNIFTLEEIKIRKNQWCLA